MMPQPQLSAPAASVPITAAPTSLTDKDDVRQCIIFTVGSEEYGIGILAVREIRGWTPENRLPNLPPHIRGIINLRGIIIPILDLRARFGGGATEATKTHVVIVIQVGAMSRGLLVDAISDILTISRDQIKPVPAMEIGEETSDYLMGLVTVEQRMVTLLDATRLFAGDTIIDPGRGDVIQAAH